ncbi:MAG: XrtA/PEP-CTERM system histidine kinase PrsK [Chthoniobacteraceae bacterium]
MSATIFLESAAALFCGALALAAILSRRRSAAGWFFFFGMVVLAVESAVNAAGARADEPRDVAFWRNLAFVSKAFLPGFWLCFSVIYSRGNYREWLSRWRVALVLSFLLPVGLALAFPGGLLNVVSYPDDGGEWWLKFTGVAKVINGLLLVGMVLILMNLERTFRAAVGTMRWRIKFLILGLGAIFGAGIYTQSQALLFPGYNPEWTQIETVALLIGCTLMAVGYVRSGFAESDVYPSRTVLHRSLTVALAGGYLFAIGVLAQVVAFFGGLRSVQTQAFIVVAGLAVLAVGLLSERFRQGVRRFVSEHFHRPGHDSREIWTRLTERTGNVLDEAGLCGATARLISETFQILSVTIWVVDESESRFAIGGSSAQARTEITPAVPLTGPIRDGLLKIGRAFDLEEIREPWAEPLKQFALTQFQNGGHRVCVPLLSGERLFGVAMLADRVNAAPYTIEEMELLKCMADQIAAGLVRMRLTGELMMGKEIQAFQTMSAFFVHDLKNAANTLNLMLQNLPTHFDDPEFRKDALNGIASTVKRINELIARLGALREQLELKPVECDLNQLVGDALKSMNGTLGVEVRRDLRPLPAIVADREQVQSVVVNLLINARDAIGSGGTIEVATGERDGQAMLSVADNGCGMSAAFLKDSLFRPFHSTKQKGLGIGMFQSKMVVEAHRGNIQVESEPGKGTTFRVLLPLKAHA